MSLIWLPSASVLDLTHPCSTSHSNRLNRGINQFTTLVLVPYSNVYTKRRAFRCSFPDRFVIVNVLSRSAPPDPSVLSSSSCTNSPPYRWHIIIYHTQTTLDPLEIVARNQAHPTIPSHDLSFPPAIVLLPCYAEGVALCERKLLGDGCRV